MRISDIHSRHSIGLPNFLMVTAVLLLICIGLAAIYSATTGQQGVVVSKTFQHQLYWFLLGIVLFLLSFSFPMQFYQAFAYLFYASILLCLIAVLFIGKAGGGAVRWLSIFGFRFQPSEWTKLAVIFAIARYIADNPDKIQRKRHLLVIAGLGALPMLLIFKQPDLGTSLVFLAIVPSMMYWAGVSPLILFLAVIPALTMIASFQLWSFFLVMGILIVILIYKKIKPLFIYLHVGFNIIVGIFTPYFWNSLHEYQQNRILSFLGLVHDPKGISYQVIQSKVAIGSGGFGGKGFLAGTQTQLRFLPEQHTDFIFTVIGEELGFVGSVIVLLLFTWLLIRSLQIALSVRNRFASLVAIGITTMFLYHYFVNLGMVMGIMPVTGLPLPFISYGGSFLNASMVSVALLLNFSYRRQEF